MYKQLKIVAILQLKTNHFLLIIIIIIGYAVLTYSYHVNVFLTLIHNAYIMQV